MRVMVLVALAALSDVAVAGDGARENPAPPPQPRLATTVLFGGGAHHVGPIGLGLVGLDLEVALGAGRWQVYAEGEYLRVGEEQIMLAGTLWRAGGGARVIAAQWAMDGQSGPEMYVEGGAGIERFEWDGGGRLTRTDATFGWGVQMRIRFRQQHFAVRLGLQFFVGMPEDHERAARILCKGTCPDPAPEAPADIGLYTQMGFGWGW